MSFVHWLEDRPALSWTVVITYALIIFYLSPMPFVAQPFGLPNYTSNIEHLIEYAGFGFFMLVAFKSRRVESFIPALLLSSLYGLFDEFHQIFVPGRNASVMDFSFDVAGCLIGVLIAEQCHRNSVINPK